MHVLFNHRFIIDQGHISHNEKLGVFTILGTAGNAHAVRLFPSESYTCPSTGRCYHIIAALRSVGLEDMSGRKRVNSLSAVRLYIGARVVINLREAPINRLSRICTLCNGLWRRETPSLKPYNRLATPL